MEMALYVGMAIGAVVGIVIGVLIAPREYKVSQSIDAGELAREINRQGGFHLSTVLDPDDLRAALLAYRERTDAPTGRS